MIDWAAEYKNNDIVLIAIAIKTSKGIKQNKI